MGKAVNNHAGVEDKATMRQLGLAVFGMCIGALGLVAIAITVGSRFG